MASRYEEERAAERLREHRANVIASCALLAYVLTAILVFSWCWQRPTYPAVPNDGDKAQHFFGSTAASIFWPVWLVGAVAMVVTEPREG